MTERTSLYRHFDDKGRLLYVGIAYDVMSRLRQHGKAGACWFWDVATIRVEHYDSRDAAIHAEAKAIRDERPVHNLKLPIPAVDFEKPGGRPLAKMVLTGVRLPADVRDRIVAVAGQNRMAEFIREAIDAELERRENAAKPEG